MDASVLVVAGAETTATTLSAVTYLLLTNPSKMSKLLAEVRGAFKRENEITIVTVNQLDYMLACLNEAMRLFPPVPIGLPRIVPSQGRSIGGHYIPGNVCKTHPFSPRMCAKPRRTSIFLADSCVYLALGSIQRSCFIHQSSGILP